MLSVLQQDALKEFMNVSIGQAASLLSEMANQKIELAIPAIELSRTEKLSEKESMLFSNIFKGYIVSSSLAFGNEFKGKAHLIFPVPKGKRLVGLFMGDELSLENDNLNDFSDTDIDAMKEISNIILNTIIGSFGNLLNRQIIYSLPEVDFLNYPEQESELSLDTNYYVLLIRTTFSMIKDKIEGAIFIILTMDSVSSLLGKIDEMLVELYG